MNEHLKPVFDILLPGLEKAGIEYWVYGGVSVAAYVGEFIRENDDVDVFVRNDDFEKAKATLNDLCSQNDFFIEHHPAKEKEKPKTDIKINKDDDEEMFAIIPVYEKDGSIEFKYSQGSEYYSKQILEIVERNIVGFRFFTPQNTFIKEIFIKHMEARPGKKRREEHKKDAKALLTHQELIDGGWNII